MQMSLFVTVGLTCLALLGRLVDSKLLSSGTKTSLMIHPHHTVEHHEDNGAAILFSKVFNPSIQQSGTEKHFR